VLNGCSGSPSISHASVALSAPTAPLRPALASTPIKQIIAVVQKNRCFDNLFHGFPGADLATTGVMHDGTHVALVRVPLEAGADFGHFHYSFDLAYDA